MSTPSNRGALLWASFLTLIAAGMGFAVRGGILGVWGKQFGFTGLDLGTITGGGLVGFGVVILLASLILDRIGYKTVLLLAFVLHIVSVVVTVMAPFVYGEAGNKDGAYWCLYVGMFSFAIANGLCEAAINPLVAQLYPDNKTHYLNILHAGWPGGLIIGGLIGFLLGTTGKLAQLQWEILWALYLIPTVWYGFIVLKEKFPISDVEKAGVSFGEMLKEFAHPVLLLLLLLHACVGYVELGTDSWITNITERLVGNGFLLFIYASAIMFILRFFAGPIVHRINPLGLLCISSVLGCIGLLMISYSTAAAMAWLAVTIYGVGKTFLWPTMLGVVGERFPKGGAVTMGAIGAVGMLSAGLLGGPGIGYKQDYYASANLKENSPAAYERYKAEKASSFLFFPEVTGLDGQMAGLLLEGTTEAPTPGKSLKDDKALLVEKGLTSEEIDRRLAKWNQLENTASVDRPVVGEASIFGGRMALRWTAAVPAAMFLGYLLLVLYFRLKGGYKTLSIAEEEHLEDIGER